MANELAVLSGIEARVKRSLDVVDVVDRTHELKRGFNGELMRPEGMSDAEWNLHCDAMQSTRNVPSYLAEHFRRVDTAQKLAGGDKDKMPPIAGFVVHLVQRREYPVIDVTVNKEE